MSTVTFVDADRQWFKSVVGLEVRETDLGSSICVHAIKQSDPLIIPDTRRDPRCVTNPSVTGEMNIRAYVGVPLRLAGGEAVGTLTVMDHQPREFGAAEIDTLVALSRAVTSQLQLRLQQQTLTELTAHYAEAQRLAGVGSWTLDVTTNELTWSDQIYRIFGVQRDEFGGTFEAFLSFVHPDDREMLQSAQASALSDTGVLDVEHRIVRPDGTVRRVHERARFLIDSTVSAATLAGTVQDVTDRATAQELLRSQEENYRMLFDAHPQPMWVYDEDSLQFLAVNEAAVQRYGWSRDEFDAMTILELRDPEDRPALLRQIADPTPGPRTSGYWRHVTKHGAALWVEIVSNRLQYNNRDARLVVASDVTARRLAEQELRRADALRRAASSAARLGGWALDLTSQQVQLSEEARELLDAPKHLRITLERCLALVVPESRATVSEALTRCLETGQPCDLEFESITMTGRHFWARLIAEAERDDRGTIVRIGGGVQDITERRKLEQQFLRAQRMESIGTLAGGIAHDLNNVLAPIMMSIELLREPLSDEERNGTLDTIESSARRGAEMVSQVLSFARGVEGNRVAVSPRRLLDDAKRLIVETFPRNIAVHAEVAADTPFIAGDPTQLHQVLLNLAVNARDAMPTGGTLRFSAQPLLIDQMSGATSSELAPGSYVMLVVEDSGTGIPADQLDRIFDPFFTTKAVGKGTGLGLSTSLAILRSHGGTLRAYSEAGRGTVFRAYIPSAGDAADIAELVPKSSHPRGRGELVLVVDDEAAVRDITKQTLETFGYRVIVAADGAEGVVVFAEQGAQIALVLTDMMMPVMDGVTMINVLRRLRPDVRIIAASGLAANGSVARAVAAGVEHFLPKPYTASTLLNVLHTVLNTDTASTT